MSFMIGCLYKNTLKMMGTSNLRKLFQGRRKIHLNKVKRREKINK